MKPTSILHTHPPKHTITTSTADAKECVALYLHTPPVRLHG